MNDFGLFAPASLVPKFMTTIGGCFAITLSANSLAPCLEVYPPTAIVLLLTDDTYFPSP